ncbi:acyl--CoA ligase, partial [bacterium]|nr:acyl--CoA ligase [bacterium]
VSIVKSLAAALLGRTLRPLPGRHLGHLFAAAWRRRPFAPAIKPLGKDAAGVVSYGELGLAAHKIAGWLSGPDGEGLERVGILLPNSMAFAASYLACQVAGRVAVPLNYALAPREVVEVAKDAGLGLILTFTPPAGRAARLFGPTQEQLLAAIPGLRLARLDDPKIRRAVRAAPFFRPLPDNDPDAVSTLIYTSGSTGRPKGVVLTHGNLASNLEDIAAVLGIGHRDTILGVLPLFHSFGLTAGLLFAIQNGASFLPMPAFEPRLALAAIQQGKVTVLELVPSMYRALAAVASRLDDPRAAFSSVRLAVSGGAPLPEATAAEFFEVSGLAIYEGYGASEAGPVISFNPPSSPPALGTVGYPLPQVQVALRDADGAAVEGEGEIWVRGPNIFLGYHGLPEETAAVLVDGWYRTGDIGELDSDGRLVVKGRAKRMIIVAGENVYPAEIENAALCHPQVGVAVAVGMPDKTTGEAPRLFVELDGPEPEEGIQRSLVAFLRAGGALAAYKIPKEVVVVERVPLLPTGKPDIPALLGERDPIANEALR